MPHTSRKTRSKGHPKRVQVTDEAGWTHVTRGVASKRKRNSFFAGTRTEGVPFGPAAVPPDLTFQNVTDKFERRLKSWQNSRCFNELRKILSQQVLVSKAIKIDRCVCLGLGSFTGGVTSEASIYELTALDSILELLCLSSCLLLLANYPTSSVLTVS